MALIDAHIHLQDEAFTGNLDKSLQKAFDAGVSKFLCASTSKNDWLKVEKISQTYKKNVTACFGIHPWFVNNHDEKDLNKLLEFITNNPKCAIGEAGLDKAVKKNFDKEKQFFFFIKQIELSKKLKKPLVCHIVKAWDWLFEIDKKHKMPEKFILHSYSSSKNMVKKLHQMGAYFSYGSNFLSINNKKTKEALLNTPKDRLLFETDAPFMLGDLKNYKNETNQANINTPENLAIIYEQASKILDIPQKKLEKIVCENIDKLFS